MDAGTPPNPLPRARAVADLSLADLLAREQELTRRWAIGLIAARPVGSLGSLPLAAFAATGPELCAGLLRSLGSELELEHLCESASLLRGLSEEGDAAALVTSVEALRGAVWELLLEAPSAVAASARQLGEIADRLAYVCSSLLAAALTGLDVPADAAPQPQPQPRTRVVADEAAPEDLATPPRIGATIAIFDERGEGVSPPRGDWGERGVGRAGALEDHLRAHEPAPSTAAAEEDIEIRDERREEGPGAWIGSIGRQLAQYSVDRRPFAVLLAEVLELERLARGHDADALLSRLERLLEDRLAVSGGRLTRERPGRYWLLVPDTDKLAAHNLVEQLLAAVAVGESRLGLPTSIAVGVAVCPEDGERAPALAAHADVGLYAARADARAAAVRAPRDGGGSTG
ncbi:MAG TPA: hypothetical protein VGG08_00065 [Solirubrobacteraceae bacterium]|jgi:hypothetical protein